MSWLNLNQSLNSLKGQITNFASEVLSEGVVQESGDTPSSSGDQLQELQEKCKTQEAEIKSLNSHIQELDQELQRERQPKKNGLRDDEASWYWDPVSTNQQHRPISDDLEANYQSQIRALQDEISDLKAKEAGPNDDVIRLTEENKALASNLEDLDNQHQQAMERLLALKTELQKNFEFLKHEHEDLKSTNEEFSEELKSYQNQLAEKDKVIEELSAEKSGYDTLYHKYQNLERIHSLLRENAEKFQEENQELHEEVFKLQEQVTKYEHDMEMAAKHTEISDAVPRDRYEDLLKELNDVKARRVSSAHMDEVNIDDNAKTVIESLKREINELKRKLTQNETIDDTKAIKIDKILQLYNKYVNFELPVDYVGEIPTGDSMALHKLESAFKTLHSLKKDKDNLEHTLSDKMLNINHMQTQIDDLQTENDFLTTDVHHFESEFNEMKKNNDFLLNEIAALKNTSKLEPIIETHEDNIVKLESELADCNRMNKTFESEIKRVENDLEHVKAEKVSLQLALEDLRAKYTQMLKDFDLLKTKSESLDGMEEEVLTVQEDKLTNKTHEVYQLKKNLTTSEAKNEKFAIDISIIENEKVLLTKQIDDLKHELETLSKNHKDLETNKNMIETTLKDHEVKLQEANQTITDLMKSQDAAKQNEVVEAKLEELNKSNRELIEKVQKLTTEVTHLKKKEHELLEENTQLINSSQIEKEKSLALEQTITELKTKTSDLDKLRKDNEDLKIEYNATIESKNNIEKELTNINEKLTQLHHEFEEQGAELRSKYAIIDSLNETIAEKIVLLTKYEEKTNELVNTIKIKNEELETLKHNVNELNERLRNNELTENANKLLNDDKEVLANQTHMLQDELSLKSNEISKLRSQIEDLTKTTVDLKTLINEREDQIKNLNVTIQNMTVQLETRGNETKIDSNELEDLKTKLGNTEANNTELNKVLEVVNKEKAELINLVNLKHNESIQYHNEIQRLNQVLLNQSSVLQEIEKTKVCNTCDNLKVTLKEKDEIIKVLNANVTETDRLRQECANLTEKCDSFEKNLTVQLETVKRLTAENLQLLESESNCTRELDRLRQHLLETEDGYTQELMASEQKLQECMNRLRHVEDKAKQTSTVYTSNSIRANQEVETLRNQIKLLERQREEVQAQLSERDDARGRSEAALANLQMVLEQFQSDKERDIESATVKIRGKMSALERQNAELNQEIARLNSKLEEALAGLQAAARLGDQLETKVAINNDLKEQVKALQASVAAAEERYYNAISNQQDRVDKELVKNLVLNYVQAQAQSGTNRGQALRVLSTVLDFNQQECARLGLSRGATQADSLTREFVKFLQQESKPRAPPPDMSGLATRDGSVGDASSAAPSRKSSGIGPHPNPFETHRRNPSTGSNNLLLQNMDVTSQITIDSGVNQTRNTEGAILKHVLKDLD